MLSHLQKYLCEIFVIETGLLLAYDAKVFQPLEMFIGRKNNKKKIPKYDFRVFQRHLDQTMEKLKS